MLLEYFGFQHEPFGATPDPRYLYLSHTHREALASLDYGYVSNRGFTVLIAPPGMGKTTLLFRFLEEIQETARSVFLFDFDSQCEPRDLVSYILRDIGISPARSASEMHEQLTGALAKENRAGLKFVVVIDEAQSLSDAVLERIRLLTNFETSRCKLMQVVLAGHPSLADKLMQTSLTQLRQRIAIRCRLEALSAGETVAYIEHRLRKAGKCGEQLFSRDALSLIVQASQGIPRNINNLCFNALSLCFALRSKQVSASMVSEVFGDLRLSSSTSRPAETIGEVASEGSLEALQRKAGALPRKLWVPATIALLVLGAMGILGLITLRAPRIAKTSADRSLSLVVRPEPRAVADTGGIISSKVTPNPSPFEITVERNQTLEEIAVQYLGSFNLQRLEQIQALNPKLTDPDYIEAGQKIWLPGPSLMPLSSTAPPSAIQRRVP